MGNWISGAQEKFGSAFSLFVALEGEVLGLAGCACCYWGLGFQGIYVGTFCVIHRCECGWEEKCLSGFLLQQFGMKLGDCINEK